MCCWVCSLHCNLFRLWESERLYQSSGIKIQHLQLIEIYCKKKELKLLWWLHVWNTKTWKNSMVFNSDTADGVWLWLKRENYCRSALTRKWCCCRVLLSWCFTAREISGDNKSALFLILLQQKKPQTFSLLIKGKENIIAETATWLVISEGMGDGGFEWVLASWETKPESWEETLLSRWAPEEGIWRRLLTGNRIGVKFSI